MSVVLITGANKGVGLELTRIYANAGDTVYACCRQPESAEALQDLSREKDVKIVGVHIGDDSSVKDMVAGLGDVTIDLLINNASMAGHPLSISRLPRRWISMAGLKP